MRLLFHYPLCPFSRKIRLALGEKKLEYQPVIEMVWKRRNEFLDLNPAGQVPVLVDEENQVVIDSYAIAEYLNTVYPDPPLMDSFPQKAAEIRRLMSWFDDKFNKEVTLKIVYEKALKRFFEQEGPNSVTLRQGISNLELHLDYFSWLLERRHWLAGDTFSFADITGAAHLSALDFLGHVPWERFMIVKEWYSRIKCRPSMRALLKDHVPGLTASEHYADLDF